MRQLRHAQKVRGTFHTMLICMIIGVMNLMPRIFRDFEIIKLARDHEEPGVFLKARKSTNWRPIDLSNIELYSIILGRRIREIVDLSRASTTRRLMLRLCESRLKWLLPGAISHLMTKRYCV